MAERHKRRNYLINFRFQMKWTIIFTSVGVLCAGAFAFALWTSFDEQNQLLQEIINTEEKLSNESQELRVQLLNMPDRTEAERLKLQREATAIAESAKVRQAVRSGVIDRNEMIRYMAMGFVAFVGLFLFVWGIFMTHKVAGPLYVILRSLEQLNSEGRADLRPLRHGDEFQDVYRDICKNIEQLSDNKNSPPPASA